MLDINRWMWYNEYKIYKSDATKWRTLHLIIKKKSLCIKDVFIFSWKLIL